MSANTQDLCRNAKEAPREFVKAAGVRAPLQLLSKENDRIPTRTMREIQRASKPKFSESYIEVDSFLNLFDEARYFSPSLGLFLRAGTDPHLASLGLYGKAVTFSENLWNAVAASRDLLKNFISSARIRVRLRNGRCRITFENLRQDHPGNDSCTQYFVAMYVLLLRQTKGYDGSGLHLYYPNARSAHSDIFPEAEALRSCPVGIVDFDEKLLLNPMTRADAWLGSVAKTLFNDAANTKLTSDNLVNLVEELQFTSISEFHNSIAVDDMARLLDLPVRTLQSKLLSENSTFVGIRNTAMHKLAKRYLSAGLSINETSELLGFQHRQSFSTAFSKWEKQPPSRFAHGR